MRDDGLPSPSCLETVPGPRDYRFGGETAFDSGSEGVDWTAHLPAEEVQYQRRKAGSLEKVFDTSSCVTFSVANACEVIYAHLRASGRVTAAQHALLDAHGFIGQDGRLNISDRDLAARSGTTQDGNNFARVCETLRTVGPIPEAYWPMEEDLKTWDEYMVPGPELPEKRAAFLSVFPSKGGIVWEWLILPGEGLTHEQKLARISSVIGTAPVLVSSPICPGWSRYVAKPKVPIDWCGKREGGHATLHLSNLQLRLDHYEPFVKTLSPDYWVNHAMRLTLVPARQTVGLPKPVAPKPSLEHGSKLPDVLALQNCLERLGYQTVKSDPKRPYYGDRTAGAVLAFQLDHAVDAPAELRRLAGRYYGPKTHRALAAKMATVA